MSEASIFASNRKHSITDNRIRNIFWYIENATFYFAMIKDSTPRPL